MSTGGRDPRPGLVILSVYFDRFAFRKDLATMRLGHEAALLVRAAIVASTALSVFAGVAAASAPSAADPNEIVVASLPSPDLGRPEGDPAQTGGSERRRGCPPVPRSEVDRPDIVAGPSIHVVYLVGADSPDQLLDQNGTLHCTLKGQNEWMEQQSGLRWNFDTFVYEREKNGRTTSSREVDITFVRSSLPAARLSGASAVRDELMRLGFSQPEKRYLTYVMGSYTTFCGDAIYPVSAHSDERRDGVYAQVYLSSTSACNAQWFGRPGEASWSDAIAQQELLHTEGLSAIGAPRSCPMVLPFGHICTGALFYAGESADDPERVDLMYPYVSLPLSQKVLDRGHDDYFNHDLPVGDLIDSPYLI